MRLGKSLDQELRSEAMSREPYRPEDFLDDCEPELRRRVVELEEEVGRLRRLAMSQELLPIEKAVLRHLIDRNEGGTWGWAMIETARELCDRGLVARIISGDTMRFEITDAGRKAVTN
jgi:hypothetical protein